MEFEYECSRQIFRAPHTLITNKLTLIQADSHRVFWEKKKKGGGDNTWMFDETKAARAYRSLS